MTQWKLRQSKLCNTWSTNQLKRLVSLTVYIWLIDRLIFQRQAPIPVIVLEDLNPEGYRTFDHPAEYSVSRNIALLLGKFHAASMFLHATVSPFKSLNWLKATSWIHFQGTDLSDFVDTDYDYKHDKFDFGSAFLLPTFEFLVQEAKNWSEFQPYIHQLEVLKPTILDWLYEYFVERIGCRYKVLTHGDFHYTNILYKNEGKRIEDLVLVIFLTLN